MQNPGGIPPFLYEKIVRQYGAGAEKIFLGFQARRVTSFRVNRLKTSAEQVQSALFEAGIPVCRAEWYADAFFLDRSYYKKLLLSPLYERGEIYLQSLSSMLPPLVLNPRPGERILDMAAAPGGKTTQLCALSEGKALITACERDKKRFDRLNYNLKKQGAVRVAAMNADASKLDDFFRFDKILLDAPCSGSGTIGADEPFGASEALLNACQRAQRALLRKAISLLREGGTLLYSTCSLLKEENENQILSVLKGSGCRLEPIPKLAPFSVLNGLPGTLTVCPDGQFEGFFLAKLVKEESIPETV